MLFYMAPWAHKTCSGDLRKKMTDVVESGMAKSEIRATFAVSLLTPLTTHQASTFMIDPVQAPIKKRNAPCIGGI